MSETKPLIDLKASLKSERHKPEHQESNNWQRSIERKKPGRKKSPRTAQIHPRVYPQVAEEIISIIEQRDITVGVFIEEIFQFWKDKSEINQK